MGILMTSQNTHVRQFSSANFASEDVSGRFQMKDATDDYVCHTFILEKIKIFIYDKKVLRRTNQIGMTRIIPLQLLSEYLMD